ncbi:MAG: hypothetical protein ACQER9_03475 [Nanobdellota archaeon]
MDIDEFLDSAVDQMNSESEDEIVIGNEDSKSKEKKTEEKKQKTEDKENSQNTENNKEDTGIKKDNNTSYLNNLLISIRNDIKNSDIISAQKKYSELYDFSSKIPKSNVAARKEINQILVRFHEKILDKLKEKKKTFEKEYKLMDSLIKKCSKSIDENDLKTAVNYFRQSLSMYKNIPKEFANTSSELKSRLYSLHSRLNSLKKKKLEKKFNYISSKINERIKYFDNYIHKGDGKNAEKYFFELEQLYKDIPDDFLTEKTKIYNSIIKRKNVLELYIQMHSLKESLDQYGFSDLKEKPVPENNKVYDNPRKKDLNYNIENNEDYAIPETNSNVFFTKKKKEKNVESPATISSRDKNNTYSSNNISRQYTSSSEKFQSSESEIPTIEKSEKNIPENYESEAKKSDNISSEKHTIDKSDELQDKNTETPSKLDNLESPPGIESPSIQTSEEKPKKEFSENSENKSSKSQESNIFSEDEDFDEALKNLKLGKIRIMIVDKKYEEAYGKAKKLEEMYPEDEKVNEITDFLKKKNKVIQGKENKEEQEEISDNSEELSKKLENTKNSINSKIKRRLSLARFQLKKGDKNKALDNINYVLNIDSQNKEAKKLMKQVS